MPKCHKFEINIRKEMKRKLDSLKAQLKSSEEYLKHSYEAGDRNYTIREIFGLQAQIDLLEEIMKNAQAAVK